MMEEITEAQETPIDERIAIPEIYYGHLQEAINDLYNKVVQENTDLVQSHQDKITPTAVFRISYEAQVKRIGEAGMLLQWFRAGFKIAED